MNKYGIFFVVLFFIFVGKSFGQTAQLWEWRIQCPSIPCILSWYDNFSTHDRDLTKIYSLDVDDHGDIFLAGSCKNINYTDRILLKYKFDGTPVYGSNITGIPWYIGSVDSRDYYDFPWQKIRVDADRNRIYVLFAAQPVEGINQYEYFLAAHDKGTGMRLSSWSGGTTTHVGMSTKLGGSFDFDSEGNIWVVTEDSEDNIVGTTGLQLRKFSKDNGSNISPTNMTPPRDYFWISSVNKRRESIGFNIDRENQNDRMIIAFREYDASGEKELVVTLWDTQPAFLDREEFTQGIGAPNSIPEALPNQNDIAHAYFSDSFLDSDGNFLVAGTFSFLRFDFEFELDYVFPIALKYGLNSSRDQIVNVFQYIEQTLYQVLYPDLEPYDVIACNGYDNSTFIRLLYTLKIDAAGNYIDNETLTSHIPRTTIESNGVNCSYLNKGTATDFKYYNGVIISAGYFEKTALTSTCGNEDIWGYINVHRFGRLYHKVVPELFTWEGAWRRFFQHQYYRWERNNNLPSQSFLIRARDRTLSTESPGSYKMKDWTKFSHSFNHVLLNKLSDIAQMLFSSTVTPEFPEKLKTEFIELLSAVRSGKFFDQRQKEDIIKKLKTVENYPKASSQYGAEVFKILNNISIDMGLVSLEKDNQTTALSVLFKNKDLKREASIKIQNSIPALVKGMIPAWPIMTFEISDRSKLKNDSVLVVVNLDKFIAPKSNSIPIILEWNGKNFRDITTKIDHKTNRIFGRTEQLRKYTIMYLE